MERQAVASRHLRSIGYDPARRQLEVEFHNGRVYHYHHVDPTTHAALRQAESIGGYFARELRGRIPHCTGCP